ALDARRPRAPKAAPLADAPAVAVLYTTCDDFVERSAESCVALDYPNFHVYLLDDSRSEAARARVDAFAARHLESVTVVRRADRRGFKAGNLNHALENVAAEPFFAVVDADEILPPNFLTDLVPHLVRNDSCGFVQANHRSRPDSETRLAQDLGVGIDIHWKWYQPLRNRYGFVMFLGHGAVLRRASWEAVGGFPELVSEDLAFAIAIREHGYHGRFVEDVVCFEEFPETVRAFRVRHVKWTRGTCEFLQHWMSPLLRAKKITTVEKLDILFPTLNLPLTFFFFLFMINAAVFLPLALGSVRPVTFVLAGHELAMPVLTFKPGVERIFGTDFYLITLMTIVAPILCFILDLARKPVRLARFLADSTALYAALSPLTFIAVLGYVFTRKAQFLVTGSTHGSSARLATSAREFWSRTHPDYAGVKAFEIAMGAGFVVTALATFQISFAGVALGFMALPLMHGDGWKSGPTAPIVWAPFVLMMAGVALGATSVLGLPSVFFGFGFHF
ncbi:MAG: glycosyltransferase, partial [Alphaproteobacteria bacterium]|nr:glycosyltransferase [Alphaproteobacteria bacterium]